MLRKRDLKIEIVLTLIAIVPFSWILQGQRDLVLLWDALRLLRLVKVWPLYGVIQKMK